MWDEIINDHLIQKLRKIARSIIPEIDLAEYYKKYRLHLPGSDNLSETQIIDKHIINWLYTIKCETGASGIKFIDIVLWSLNKTLKRDIDELQFVYVKILIIIFLKERRQWI